jgi:hypothetical protein
VPPDRNAPIPLVDAVVRTPLPRLRRGRALWGTYPSKPPHPLTVDGSGEMRRQGVAGVAVEPAAGPVIAAGGAGITVAGEVLNLVQRDAGVESQRDGGVPQRVRGDPVGGGDAGAAGQRGERAGGVAGAPAGAGAGNEQRPDQVLVAGRVGVGGAVCEVSVDRVGDQRGQRGARGAAALAAQLRDTVAAVDTANVVDIEVERFADP